MSEVVIIRFYCVCDDVLKSLGLVDDPQWLMSTAEIMTTALVAAHLCTGKYSIARRWLRGGRYMSKNNGSHSFLKGSADINVNTVGAVLISSL